MSRKIGNEKNSKSGDIDIDTLLLPREDLSVDYIDGGLNPSQDSRTSRRMYENGILKMQLAHSTQTFRRLIESV